MGTFAKRRASGKTHVTVDDSTVAAVGVFKQRQVKKLVADLNANPDKVPDMPAELISLEQCQVALTVHRSRLSAMNTLEDKVAYKVTALADFEPFLKGYVEAGHNYPNTVAVWAAIWLFDCSQVEAGLTLALHLIEQGQVSPPSFGSTLEVWLCDQMYDYAAAKFKAKESANPYYDALLAAITQHDWDLYEPVGSKMWAMAAKLASLEEDHDRVVAFGTKALEMNERAGVKKLIKKSAEFLLQKQQEQGQNTEQVTDKEEKPEQDPQQQEQGQNSEPNQDPQPDLE